jgi:hypothetical protein
MAITAPTTAAVSTIFETSLTDAQLTAFINDAVELVEALLEGTGLSDGRLTTIAKYLAAGLAELRDPRASKDSGAGTSVTYLQSTYLETAWALDTTGKLRQHFEPPDAGGARVQFTSSTRAGPQSTEASVAD